MRALDALNAHPALAERAFAPWPDPRPSGAILLWLRQAWRAWEQPTVDVALALGRALGRPVWAVVAIERGHLQASDRHARFALEAWPELHAGLAERGIAAFCHVDRPHRPQWAQILPALAAEAGLVVTDAWPMDHARPLEAAVAEAAPLLRVDSACVVPMPLVGQAHARAFAFRKAISAGLRERIARPWVDEAPQASPWAPEALPFEAVPPDLGAIAGWVAAGALAHDVGPVPGTVGGSAAGYARWAAFLARGLKAYAKDRNDPLRQGVSAMSPYLHQGMVAATRLAREAQALGGEGAEKYLDELIVWRELAFAWCHFQPDAEGVASLPAWALASLRAHQGDRRRQLPGREALDAARGPDALWNAAQAGLRRHGHLHNNLRMTWGKAFVPWRADPLEAYALATAFNHRYALDGQDPASIGGLAWCLGGFDGPYPDAPIWGRVRPRPLAAHARRLDAAAYAATYAPTRPLRVAVLGAGPAGCLAARTLADHGLAVQLVDKGRRVGGRASTRRWPEGEQWDHGLPFVLEGHADLAWWRAHWAESGALAPWEGRLGRLEGPGGAWVPRLEGAPQPWVPQPHAGAWLEALVAGLPQALGAPVVALEREGGLWRLLREGEAPIEAEALVLALPGPQAAPLLRPWAPAWAATCPAYLPTWVLMARWAEALPLPFDGARVDAGSAIAWLHREGGRPGRPEGERWVLHASHPFSQAHLEDPPEVIQAALLQALDGLAGQALPPPELAFAHRWRYAAPMGPPPGGPSPWDEGLALALAGDAWAGPSVGAALRSGQAAAGRVLDWACRRERGWA